MATKYDNVIIFGPTGAVGSSVAQEASARGATVWLAMRDTKKTIPGLDEKSGSFKRVQADLSDPASITKAVQESEAKAAFFYLLHRSQDGMKSSVSAMKEGGIEYAVFLSSFTINPDQPLDSVKPEQIIPYMHARVEMSLEEVGLAHTALRPGYFAYNIFNNFLDRSKDLWECNVLEGSVNVGDCIVPKDIGRVGGAVLAEKPSADNKEAIYIYGPRKLDLDEQMKAIKDVSGKDIKVNQQDADQFRDALLAKGIPPPLVGYFVKITTEGDATRFPIYDEAKGNVKKYSGHEPTTFEEFLKEYMS